MSVHNRPLAAAPLRDRARCAQCANPLDIRALGVGEIVHGVAVNRAQGGANQITLMERQGAWLCRLCIDDRKRGHEWEQLELFDVDGS